MKPIVITIDKDVPFNQGAVNPYAQYKDTLVKMADGDSFFIEGGTTVELVSLVAYAKSAHINLIAKDLMCDPIYLVAGVRVWRSGTEEDRVEGLRQQIFANERKMAAKVALEKAESAVGLTKDEDNDNRMFFALVSPKQVLAWPSSYTLDEQKLSPERRALTVEITKEQYLKLQETGNEIEYWINPETRAYGHNVVALDGRRDYEDPWNLVDYDTYSKFRLMVECGFDPKLADTIQYVKNRLNGNCFELSVRTATVKFFEELFAQANGGDAIYQTISKEEYDDYNEL